MPRHTYSNLGAPPSKKTPTRDSLELASLASSSPTSGLSSRTSSTSGISSSRKLSLEEDDPLNPSNPANASTRPTNHDRSYSVSSAFDFTANLFPLTSTALGGYTPIGAPTSSSLDPSSALDGGGGSLEKHKSLTYLNGLSLVVGLIIGSGIFSAPSPVNTNAGSPGASLIVWTVAGLLAWTGAASYAELGGAIPLNGGSQVYLSKILGELPGFLFTWCAVGVLKPGSAAIIAIIFGEYIVRAFSFIEFSPDGLPLPHAPGVSPMPSEWINKLVAILGLLLVTFCNCISTRVGTRMGDFFMFFKFAALLGVTVTGIVVAVTGYSWVQGGADDEWKTRGWFEGTNTSVSSWAVALYAGLWAFDGWDNTNYVVGEFVHPARDLPRVLHTAMPLVIISYLLANISYFLVLPLAVIESSNTVAVAFGQKVFGAWGGMIIALVVGGSCFGALNATTFTSGRLVYVAGKEGFLPSIFGRIGLSSPSSSTTTTSSHHPPGFLNRLLTSLLGDPSPTTPHRTLFSTPIPALLLNFSLTSIYILLGSFTSLITFYGVAGYTFYFLTVLALLILRVREPLLPRPYRTWIVTPVTFCCVSLFLLTRAVVAEPGKTAGVVGYVLIGAPVWWVFVRRRGRESGGGGRGGGTGYLDGGGGGQGAARWKVWRRWTGGG
ncbi:MAG: hypothetical protein M1817_004575 [Caeruleum heppii]|nr:MAG: hypothetical protein M1817_004575 [Caeruleum heppii]